jgi:hypothetical protein
MKLSTTWIGVGRCASRRSAALAGRACFTSRRYRAAAAIANSHNLIAEQQRKRAREIAGTFAIAIAAFCASWFAAHFIGWSAR